MRKATRSWTSWLPALTASALLGLSIASCGESKNRGSSSQASSGAPTRTAASVTAHHGYLNDGDNDIIGDADNDNNHDNDNDNSEDHKPEDNGSYHDTDDSGILTYGHRANATDRKAITAVVKRYYAAVAGADGARACAMLSRNLSEALVEDYGQGSAGPLYLSSGKTCAAVIVLLSEHSHAQIAAPFDVTSVRIGGGKAYALLGSIEVPASYITLEHRRGIWMISNLIGSALP